LSGASRAREEETGAADPTSPKLEKKFSNDSEHLQTIFGFGVAVKLGKAQIDFAAGRHRQAEVAMNHTDEDKARQRWEAKQASQDDVVLARPGMVRPSGKGFGVRPQEAPAPVLKLSKGMIKAGWTISPEGEILPPVKEDGNRERGNAKHVSEETVAKQEARKAAKRAKRKAAKESGDKPPKPEYSVPMTLYYLSGNVRQEEAHKTDTVGALEHARRMAVLFLLESQGDQVIRVVIHGPRTGDEVHTRDEVKGAMCYDKGVFDWASYLGRFKLEGDSWTPGQRVNEYLKGYQRPRRGPVLEPERKNHKHMRDRNTRVVFPRESPSRYVGDWRTPKGGR
jgi:hypothetical protein